MSHLAVPEWMTLLVTQKNKSIFQPRSPSCLTFGGSQSATRIHRNTILWSAAAETNVRLNFFVNFWDIFLWLWPKKKEPRSRRKCYRDSPSGFRAPVVFTATNQFATNRTGAKCTTKCTTRNCTRRWSRHNQRFQLNHNRPTSSHCWSRMGWYFRFDQYQRRLGTLRRRRTGSDFEPTGRSKCASNGSSGNRGSTGPTGQPNEPNKCTSIF